MNKMTQPKMAKIITLAMVIAWTGVSITAADAQNRRPDARKMTCEQVKELVRQTGGIVLTTGQYTYDRYVSDRFYCPSGMDTRNAWVQTNDEETCLIGYTCEVRIPWPSFR